MDNEVSKEDESEATPVPEERFYKGTVYTGGKVNLDENFDLEGFRRRIALYLRVVRPPDTALGKGAALAKANFEALLNDRHVPVRKMKDIPKYREFYDLKEQHLDRRYLKEHGLLGASEPEYTTSIDEGNQGIAPTI